MNRLNCSIQISEGMKSRIILCISLLYASMLTCYAQDPHFSQFFEAPLLRNPSLAGLFEGDIRFQAVYRNQWGSVTVPYETVSMNGQYKIPIGRTNDFITTGLQLMYDRAGTTNFTTTNIYPAVNYHKSLNGERSKYLSVGVMGGYVQRRIDRSKITTNNQFDGGGHNPSLDIGETLTTFSYDYFDASVGASFNSSIAGSETDYYFIGAAFHHFNRPINSFYRNPPVELNPKLVFSGGVRLSVDDRSLITIQGDHSMQGEYSETIAGATYTYRIFDEFGDADYAISFGGYLRWKDAIIPVVKIDYNPFSIAFSYDANISQLRTASQMRGGFETSIVFNRFLDRDNSTKNSVLCPTF